MMAGLTVLKLVIMLNGTVFSERQMISTIRWIF
ncbi:hypothetical protein J437_LFUL000525 [Ladona fulva]|uniref:Uncharacterized protein n=1 Tax=Ladona fulva TaxID=123851 RepID=A0A8K0NU74_LADFU|nr:hypothetical protein J437_LFUL000525 [Ladona fulva]